MVSLLSSAGGGDFSADHLDEVWSPFGGAFSGVTLWNRIAARLLADSMSHRGQLGPIVGDELTESLQIAETEIKSNPFTRGMLEEECSVNNWQISQLCLREGPRQRTAVSVWFRTAQPTDCVSHPM